MRGACDNIEPILTWDWFKCQGNHSKWLSLKHCNVDRFEQGKNEWKVTLCILLSSYKLKHMYIHIITCMWKKIQSNSVLLWFSYSGPGWRLFFKLRSKRDNLSLFQVFFSVLVPRAATFIKNIVQITKEQIQYDKLTNTLIPFECIFSLYSDQRIK